MREEGGSKAEEMRELRLALKQIEGERAAEKQALDGLLSALRRLVHTKEDRTKTD